METSKEDRLLALATQEFLRHGFGRVKMNDLAKSAGISRAALYQLFSSKEQLFRKICTNLVEGLILEIQEKLGSCPDRQTKIRLAFEIWGVKNFDLSRQSVEAQELFDLGIESSRDILEQGFLDFERLLSNILPPGPGPTPEFLAHILASALRGLKKTAKDGAELRSMIEGLLNQCGL